jgi:hypothetical protein
VILSRGNGRPGSAKWAKAAFNRVKLAKIPVLSRFRPEKVVELLPSPPVKTRVFCGVFYPPFFEKKK